MIYWLKKRSIPNINSLEEIVVTTIRNRMGNYILKEYNIDNPDYAKTKILQDFATSYEGISLTSTEIIDVLVRTIENYEHNLYIATEASKKEYGM